MPNDSEQRYFSAQISYEGPVFFNRRLSEKARLLYGLICSMSRAPRYYAFAHNDVFVEFLSASERTVQRCLKELEQAGEIRIEDDQGGRKTLRKIYPVRMQPFNPDTSVGVNPDTGVGVTNNSINNKIKAESKKAPPPADEKEILEYLNQWAVKLNACEEDTHDLVSELHAFFDMRKAKRKPMLTMRSASILVGKLKRQSAEEDYPLASMIYMLQTAINEGWDSPWPIKDSMRDDYALFLRERIGEPEPEAERSTGWQ